MSDGNILSLSPDDEREVLAHVWDSFPWELELDGVITLDFVHSKVSVAVDETGLADEALKVVRDRAVGNSERAVSWVRSLIVQVGGDMDLLGDCRADCELV